MAKGEDVRGLSASDTVHSAAVKILWTRFDDMWSYRDAVLEDFDIEGVHDMRVASRRLRTAMQMFRPCFTRRSYREHYDCVKALADLLGQVRDRDVLLDELKADRERRAPEERVGLDGMMAELKSERKGYRESLRRMLDDLNRNAYDRAFLTYLARST